MALIRTQVLYWASEGPNYGQAPGWATTDAHLAHEIGQPQISAVTLPRPVAMGGRLAPERVAVLGRRTATMSFRSELKGATGFGAAQPPDFHALLEAAGFDGVWAAGPATWTYTRPNNLPGSTAYSASVRWQVGDDAAASAYHWLSGCRADVVFDFVPGEVVRPQWTVSGFWLDNVAAALGQSYAADIAPPVLGDTAWAPFVAAPAFGAIGQIRRATLALRNNVGLIPGLHNGSAPGGGRYDILGYGPADDPGSRITIDVEAADSAALDDWLDRWTGRTVGATGTSITVGSALTNTIDFNLGRLEVRSIQPVDLDGVYGFRVELAIMAAVTADTTNTDVVIVCT